VKRILSALAMTASIAALTLGAAGTANAKGKEATPPVPFGFYINEVSASPGTMQDYIELAFSGAPTPLETDLAVRLSPAPGLAPITLTTIPAGTRLEPGDVYTIAHVTSNIGCVDQFFTQNLPENATFRLTLAEVEPGTPTAILDRATITPTSSPGVPPNPALSQHRVAQNMFAPGPKTPCVFS
jgi:hypothetical protein